MAPWLPASSASLQVEGSWGLGRDPKAADCATPQASNTVTSFQRYHEALNTPFELDLSEEPGNPELQRGG